MHRRTILSALAAGLTAGCGGAGTPTPTPPCTGATEPPAPAFQPGGDGRTKRTSAGSATVAIVGLRAAVPTPAVGSPAHVDVAAPAGEQFVVAEVILRDGAGEPRAPDGDLPLAVEVDGERNPRGRPVLVDTFGWNSGGTPVAFPVAAAAAESAALVWTPPDGEAVRFPLAADVVSRFPRTPAFAVETLAAPDRVTRGDPFPVRLAVANDGDRAGRFLAEFGTDLVSDVGEVSFPVPAGRTRDHCFQLRPGHYPPGRSEVDVVLRRGSTTLRRPVAVASRAP